MTTLTQHLEQRPEMPRPFIPDSPEAIAYQKAFQAAVDAERRSWIKEHIQKTKPDPVSQSRRMQTQQHREPSKGRKWDREPSKHHGPTDPVCRDCGKPRMPRNQWCEACKTKMQEFAAIRRRVRDYERKQRQRSAA